MKFTVFLCTAALAFASIEGSILGRGCAKSCPSGACMKTTYVGKMHETNCRGEEECVGTFSGSNTFEQPADCCWSNFAEKCKELLGGLVNVLSATTSCGSCGTGRTSVDLDVKSRITKEAQKPKCETVPEIEEKILINPPVYKQVVYKPTEQCDDCHHHHHHHHKPHHAVVQPQVQQVVVPQPVFQAPQPVFPVVEEVRVIPVKEECDDCEKHKHHKKDDCDECDEKKKHHHKHKHHKKHHHKHHKKDNCDDDCD